MNLQNLRRYQRKEASVDEWSAFNAIFSHLFPVTVQPGKIKPQSGGESDGCWREQLFIVLICEITPRT